jgi:hypothetical protein
MHLLPQLSPEAPEVSVTQRDTYTTHAHARFSLSHTHARTHTHAQTHTHVYASTRIRTHTYTHNDGLQGDVSVAREGEDS